MTVLDLSETPSLITQTLEVRVAAMLQLQHMLRDRRRGQGRNGMPPGTPPRIGLPHPAFSL